MRNTRKVVAALAALILAAATGILLATRAHDLSPVPDVLRGVPAAAAAFGALERIDPWLILAALAAMLAWLFYLALPRRTGEEENPDLVELAYQIGAHREESREQLLALRDELAGEIERATAEFESRVTETLRKGISAQDTQVRKTLDHFNARAGWQIQQLSAQLEGLPASGAAANRAPSP